MSEIKDYIVLTDVNGQKVMVDPDEFLRNLDKNNFSLFAMDIKTIATLRRGYIKNSGASRVEANEVDDFFKDIAELKKLYERLPECDVTVDFSEIHESILALLVIENYKQKHQDYPKHTDLELNRRAGGEYTSDGMLKIKIDKQCADIMEIFNHGLKYKK